MKNDKSYQHKHIPVTIDKSHLVTIGEKLYTEKLSFLRELVNNAYDADATEVRISINEQLTQHIARILTKELTLKTGIRDAEQAFALQAGLLTDALRDKSV